MRRMTRRAYFLFFLLSNLIVAVGYGFLALSGVYFGVPSFNALLVVVTLVLSLALIVLSVRRFHDMNTTGWWAAFLIVPLINLLVFLVLILWPGTVGPNDYGRDPRRRASRNDPDRGRDTKGLQLDGL